MKFIAVLSAALAFGVIANHAQAEDAAPGPVFDHPEGRSEPRNDQSFVQASVSMRSR